MNPVILFRRGDHTDDAEFKAAKRSFDVYESRCSIPRGSFIIPRYSALPFNRELEMDAHASGSKLINSHRVHSFIADLRQWYPILSENAQRTQITPRTWTHWHALPNDRSFVVKGVTNSRKGSWNTRMFAQTRDDVPRIASSLLDDALLAEQGLVVREYVPLRTFKHGLNGIPITNEWRFFCMSGQIVDSGFYWSTEPDYEWNGVDDNDVQNVMASRSDSDTLDFESELRGNAPAPRAARTLVQEVLRRLDEDAYDLLGEPVPFVVIDVAEKQSGGWIVIELNDACQSGLSCIPPERFYPLLRQAV